jgi:hypothetical protein
MRPQRMAVIPAAAEVDRHDAEFKESVKRVFDGPREELLFFEVADRVERVQRFG